MQITPKLQFVDLSHYSWPVDWDKLHDNPDLIAVGWKCTQGPADRLDDAYYKAARKEIQSRGFLFMAYHFGDHSDPVAQAKNFIDTAEPDDTMRLAVDWEDNRGNQMTRADVEAFISEVDRLTGRTITVYSGNTAKDLMGNSKSELLGRHPLWIPRYSSLQPVPQASWPDWDIWQYAADGSGPQPNVVAGCSGHPDCNVFSQPIETVIANWSGKVNKVTSTPVVQVAKPKVIITIDAGTEVEVSVVRK